MHWVTNKGWTTTTATTTTTIIATIAATPSPSLLPPLPSQLPPSQLPPPPIPLLLYDVRSDAYRILFYSFHSGEESNSGRIAVFHLSTSILIQNRESGGKQKTPRSSEKRKIVIQNRLIRSRFLHHHGAIVHSPLPREGASIGQSPFQGRLLWAKAPSGVGLEHSKVVLEREQGVQSRGIIGVHTESVLARPCLLYTSPSPRD